MSKTLKSHLSSWIYVRTSHRDACRRYIYELRGWNERRREERFNYWIFTFLTQNLNNNSNSFLILLRISHCTASSSEEADKIIIHRASNGCKSFRRFVAVCEIQFAKIDSAALREAFRNKQEVALAQLHVSIRCRLVVLLQRTSSEAKMAKEKLKRFLLIDFIQPAR